MWWCVGAQAALAKLTKTVAKQRELVRLRGRGAYVKPSAMKLNMFASTPDVKNVGSRERRVKNVRDRKVGAEVGYTAQRVELPRYDVGGSLRRQLLRTTTARYRTSGVVVPGSRHNLFMM